MGKWVSGGIRTARLLSTPQHRARGSLSQGSSSPEAAQGEAAGSAGAPPSWALSCCRLPRAGEKGTWKPLFLERMRISL